MFCLSSCCCRHCCRCRHCCCQADLHAKLPDPSLNLAIQNHEYGMPPTFYDRWPILKQWFNILTTSKDRAGVEYISTMEAKKYPFTGTVWQCGVVAGGCLGCMHKHSAFAKWGCAVIYVV